MSVSTMNCSSERQWSCGTCTFLNKPLFLACEMCGAAKSGASRCSPGFPPMSTELDLSVPIVIREDPDDYPSQDDTKKEDEEEDEASVDSQRRPREDKPAVRTNSSSSRRSPTNTTSSIVSSSDEDDPIMDESLEHHFLESPDHHHHNNHRDDERRRHSSRDNMDYHHHSFQQHHHHEQQHRHHHQHQQHHRDTYTSSPSDYYGGGREDLDRSYVRRQRDSPMSMSASFSGFQGVDSRRRSLTTTDASPPPSSSGNSSPRKQHHQVPPHRPSDGTIPTYCGMGSSTSRPMDVSSSSYMNDYSSFSNGNDCHSSGGGSNNMMIDSSYNSQSGNPDNRSRRSGRSTRSCFNTGSPAVTIDGPYGNLSGRQQPSMRSCFGSPAPMDGSYNNRSGRQQPSGRTCFSSGSPAAPEIHLLGRRSDGLPVITTREPSSSHRRATTAGISPHHQGSTTNSSSITNDMRSPTRNSMMLQPSRAGAQSQIFQSFRSPSRQQQQQQQQKMKQGMSVANMNMPHAPALERIPSAASPASGGGFMESVLPSIAPPPAPSLESPNDVNVMNVFVQDHQRRGSDPMMNMANHRQAPSNKDSSNSKDHKSKSFQSNLTTKKDRAAMLNRLSRNATVGASSRGGALMGGSVQSSQRLLNMQQPSGRLFQQRASTRDCGGGDGSSAFMTEAQRCATTTAGGSVADRLGGRRADNAIDDSYFFGSEQQQQPSSSQQVSNSKGGKKMKGAVRALMAGMRISKTDHKKQRKPTPPPLSENS
jgi:hypothetical protein